MEDRATLKFYYEKYNKGFECKMLPISLNLWNKAAERKAKFVEASYQLDKKHEALEKADKFNMTGEEILDANKKLVEYKRLEHDFNIDIARMAVDTRDLEEAHKAMIQQKNTGEFWQEQDLVEIAAFVKLFREAAGI